jgi:SAM-dependent methyltransferase
MLKNAWYEDWFASPYYPLLYAHRDEKEAEIFLRHLITFLKPISGARIWDLACGNGRHARFLSQQGYHVTGTDLSEPFIAYAQQHALPGQAFLRQDMRSAAPGLNFDYVFNLFTAFGYFDDAADDEKVICQVHTGLKPGGIMVLDYLNLITARQNLVSFEEKVIQNIHFTLRRSIHNGRLYKEIEVVSEGHSHRYEESVKVLYLADFQNLFQSAGFKIIATWGDYQGVEFHADTSPRLIIFAEKI